MISPCHNIKQVILPVNFDPRLFTLTLDFLPSPSTFYPHPRLFTLTLDIGPSTLDPRQKPKLIFEHPHNNFKCKCSTMSIF